MNTSSNIDILRLSNERAKLFTRECLLGALLRLGKKKPFDKITISELVKCEGVSRTSFYRNYNTIEDIIKIPVLEIIDALKASADSEKYKSNPALWYSDLITYLENYKEVLEALLLVTNGEFAEINLLNDIFEPIDKGESGEYGHTIFKRALRAILAKLISEGFNAKPEMIASI